MAREKAIMDKMPETAIDIDGGELSSKAICEWIVNTCLTCGCSLSTAYQVAGLFIKGARGE